MGSLSLESQARLITANNVDFRHCEQAKLAWQNKRSAVSLENKRSAVSLVIQNQTRLTQKMDCHDLTSSSLAMTDLRIVSLCLKPLPRNDSAADLRDLLGKIQ